MDGQITRRKLLGASAVGGAALLGTSGLASAAASESDGDGFLADAVPGGAVSASAVPLTVPVAAGAQALTLGFVEFHPVATASFPPTDTVYAGLPDRIRGEPAPGPLNATCSLPAGAALTKVEVFGFGTAAITQPWQIAIIDMTTTAPPTTLGSPILSGTGLLTGALDIPSVVVGAGQWLVVQGGTSATAWIVGAVVHYVPAAVPEPPAPPAPPVLVPITPQRVYDSRAGGGKLQPDQERVVSVANALSGAADVVPASATAVAITLTVTDTDGNFGYVSGFPFGTSWSGTSTINWFGTGQSLATAAILALGGDRQLVLRGGVAATHVIVDVTAYLA